MQGFRCVSIGVNCSNVMLVKRYISQILKQRSDSSHRRWSTDDNATCA